MNLLVLSALVAVCSALPQYYDGSHQETRPPAGSEQTADMIDNNQNGYTISYKTNNIPAMKARENGLDPDDIPAQGAQLPIPPEEIATGVQDDAEDGEDEEDEEDEED